MALTRHEERAVLILKDPGGELPERVLERHNGRSVDLTRLVRIAIPLATAICQVYEHDLIHKDIAPANILSCSRSMLAIGKNSSCVAQCP